MQKREINVWKILQVLFFIFSKLLYRIFFRENAKPNDLYRKVWRKTISEKDQKEDGGGDSSVRPFTIHISDATLKDLRSRLENTRFGTVLKNSKLTYGFSPDYLQTLTKYWKDHYKWRQHEQELNKYPHFKTTIEDLDVHFMHVKFNPQEQSRKITVIPLLLIHTWPGSFTDFRKIIPLLTMSRPGHKIVFNVVCPSIPGSGFSEAPQHEGFNANNLSDILVTLMDRLGYSKFYVHGNGWGSVIASVMARYYPTKVKGLHVTMCFSLPNVFDSIIKSVVVSICPFLVSSAEYRIIFPLKKRLRILFEETGSLHMLSTKPDILGCALTDSPVGMAACVLEKLRLDMKLDHRRLQDGKISETILLDEFLTAVSILWFNDSFISSTRIVKESIDDILQGTHDKLPLVVPCGVAYFPNEMFILPRFMMDNLAEDLVSYNVMPRGGHFAAMEEPHLLAYDIWKFVQVVENRPTILQNM